MPPNAASFSLRGVSCRALSKVVSFSSLCACFGRSLRNAWGSGGRVCDILARSGFNSNPEAGIKRRIGRFLSDSPAPLSYFVGINFYAKLVGGQLLIIS